MRVPVANCGCDPLVFLWSTKVDRTHHKSFLIRFRGFARTARVTGAGGLAYTSFRKFVRNTRVAVSKDQKTIRVPWLADLMWFRVDLSWSRSGLTR